MTHQQSLSQPYQPQILGLGEVYEQISVERKRKVLRRRFKQGTLFLSGNKDHSGQGFTLSQLEAKVRNQGYQVLAKGWVDSPPLKSNKVSRPRPWIKSHLLIAFAKIIFRILVYFEFFWEGSSHSHMVFCLGVKK